MNIDIRSMLVVTRKELRDFYRDRRTFLMTLLLWIVARTVDRVRLRNYGIEWNRRSLPGLLIGLGVSLVVVVGAYAALTALGYQVPVSRANFVWLPLRERSAARCRASRKRR